MASTTITSAQETQILDICVGLFNAAPGASVLSSCATFIENGGTMQNLAAGLAGSSYFTTGVMGGKVTVAGQVTQLMANFGLTYGAADTVTVAAQAWFTGEVNAGIDSFGTIVYDATAFLATPSLVAAGGYGAVANTMANKAAVAQYYSDTLQSSPATGAALSAYQNVVSAVTATTFASINGVLPTLTTPQLAAIAAPIITAGGGAVGSTFNLTTGIDIPTITGAATIYGTFNGTGATYTAGDNLSAASNTGTSLILSDLGTGANFNATNLPVTVANIATLTISTGEALTVNTVSGLGGFSGLTQLNLTTADNAANADVVTAAATTNVSVTDSSSAATGTITINGGLGVTLTETDTDAGGNVLLSNISIGATTGAAGAVTVTATESLVGTQATGNITVANSTGNVTINSTVNDGVAVIANAGAQAAGKASLITVTNAATGTGAVVVNDALAITSTTTIGTVAPAVTISGGSSTITVNETVSTTQSATTVSTITEGAVTITGGAATTAVTVNEASKAAGKIVATASAAVVGANGVTAVTAAPGLQAVAVVTKTTTAAAAAAVATGTPTVTADSVVTIADLNYNTTTANSIKTVTLNGYGNSTFTGNALTTLTLAGTGGTLGITNATAGGATPTANNTLALTVTGLAATGANGTSNAISDSNNEITTLNITATSNSTLVGSTTNYATTAFTDTGLTTVTLAGAGVLTMGAWGTAPATLTVTGTAGYTGFITDTTTVFNASGSTGRDIIGISAVPTKAITGSSATNNEVLINAAAVADTTASAASLTAFNTNITGFKVLGVTGNVSGVTFDLSKFTTAFSTIDVNNAAVWNGGVVANTTLTFTKVTAGTALSLDGTNTGTIIYQTSDTNASADTVTVNLTTSADAISALTLYDATAINGLGTVNITTTGTGNSFVGAGFVDTGITNLNISGAGSLAFITSPYADSATTLTINNTSTSVAASVAAGNFQTLPVNFFAITDNNLANLSFAGSNSTDITTLNDTSAAITINSTSTGFSQIQTFAATGGAGQIFFTGTGTVDVAVLTSTAATIAIANNGTGSVAVGDAAFYSGSSAGLVDANITSLTLTGQVAFGANSATQTTAIGGVNLVTIAAGTDNAHINVAVGATANGSTTSYVLGNGNDYFTSASTAGQVTLTVGTGSNLIDLSLGSAATYLASVTLGTHTATSGIDKILLPNTSAALTSADTVITGAVTGDQIKFVDTATSVVTLTSGQLATAAAFGTLANALANVDVLAGTIAHSATAFVWGGNTYVVESAAAGNGTLTANDGFIELVGTHTLSSTVTAGVITLAS